MGPYNFPSSAWTVPSPTTSFPVSSFSSLPYISFHGAKNLVEKVGKKRAGREGGKREGEHEGKEGWRKNIKHQKHQIQLCLILLSAGQGHSEEMVEGLSLFG